MAAITSEPQQEFALHSLNEEHKNKTFVFVKLTDSALKSIEDYMSLNAAARQGIARPTIQFQSESNQGAITLPLAGAAGKNEIRYSFNLSNVDADGPQGSFEFLRQRKANRYEECIESLGSMLIKMQIHASDDIYQKTKVKMANAELDAKKHSTKVIKETGPNVGRKIKKTIISSSTNNNTLNGDHYKDAYKEVQPHVNLNVNSNFESNQSPKSSASSSKYLTGKLGYRDKEKLDEPPASCLNSINLVTSKEPAGQTVTLNVPSTAPAASQSANPLKSSAGAATATPQNPELLRKPIRDRVVHLLALRPFKKPELHAKLSRDGIREKDKKGLGVLLSQVSSLKDNAYHLHRGAWHEVQEDWPFYTADERELVRKRNPLHGSLLSANSTACNSSSAIKDSNSSISPLATFDYPQQQSPLMAHSPSNKRAIESASATASSQPAIAGSAAAAAAAAAATDYDYATANKKQRISHHKTNSEQQAIKKRSPPLSNSIVNTSSSLINHTAVNGGGLLNGRSASSAAAAAASNQRDKKMTSSSLPATSKYDDVINIWENKPKTPDEPMNGQTNGHSNGPLNGHSNGHSNGHAQLNGNHSSPDSSTVNSKLDSKLDNRLKSSKSGGSSSAYRSNGSANHSLTSSAAAAAADRYQPAAHSSAYGANAAGSQLATAASKEAGNHFHSNQFHHSNAAASSSNFSSFANHYGNSNPHNSSLCSTPNSSPDSGTGSNDGSLSASSSRSLNCSSNEQPDYLR